MCGTFVLFILYQVELSVELKFYFLANFKDTQKLTVAVDCNWLCTAVAGSSWRHTVLQVLSNWSQHHCRWLHQWSGCTVGYYGACWSTQTVKNSWQGQRCTWLSGI